MIMMLGRAKRYVATSDEDGGWEKISRLIITQMKKFVYNNDNAHNEHFKLGLLNSG